MQRTEHGSAQLIDHASLIGSEFEEEGGIPLGHHFGKPNQAEMLNYHGDRHIFTCASNRSGKGVSAIIPTLLDYQGGIICIDPKGENAKITAIERAFGMGQNVQVLDPWNIAMPFLTEEMGKEKEEASQNGTLQRASFNPLDMLTPDSPDLVDDAMMVCDTIIMETGGDTHWSTEAKAAMQTFVLHVVTSPIEEGHRHLGRVRELISLPPAELGKLIQVEMAQNGVPVVRNGANRLLQKSEKELQSVFSTVSANTHFLDSSAIQDAIQESTFDFADLKDEDTPLTVYLVLPSERLQTHGRWLRMLISMALTAVIRRPGKPKKSALFILDELAALGRLSMVEQAFGLMAGYGMRIWAIFQDISQLQDLYQKRWQTFISNAGVVQVFGVSDVNTAQYISQMMGKTTMEFISEDTQKRRSGAYLFSAAKPDYTSMTDRQFSRDLLTPDEIMRMEPGRQLLLFSGMQPIYAGKLPYYQNSRYYFSDGAELTEPRFTQLPEHPVYEGDIIAVDRFTRARGTGKPPVVGAAPQPPSGANSWGGYLVIALVVAVMFYLSL